RRHGAADRADHGPPRGAPAARARRPAGRRARWDAPAPRGSRRDGRTPMTVPRSILCATDLSPIGNAAVAVAYGLARPGTVVHLLHVAEPALVLSPLDGTLLTYRSTTADMAAVERRALARMRALVPDASLSEGGRPGVNVL